MTVTVIVATYNRAALLDECLEHLRRQRFEPGDEIVVVDNGSTDSTPAVIRRHQSLFGVRLYHLEEPHPGKSRALARGLTIASGEILAFTDDDVNVEDGWLDAIRLGMRDENVALLGGAVAPRWEHRAPGWLKLNPQGYGRLASPLALLDYGRQTADLGPRTVLGANLVVRRSAIALVGGFAPHLGRIRGTLLSGEDQDLCRRVQAAGFRAVYCPNARVRHWVPASRVSVRYFLAWFFWLGITHAALDDAADAEPGRRSIFGLPLYLVRRFMGALLNAPAAWLFGGTSAALDRAVDAAFAAGYAAGRWGLVAVERPAVRPAGDVA